MKKYYIITLVLLVFSISSCEDRLEELNLDPNRQEASEANPGFLFAQSVHLPTFKENFAQQLGYATVHGTYSNYFANLFPSAFPADSYANANDYSDFGFWKVYWRAIPLVNQAIILTNDDGEFAHPTNNAMINIWKVYLFSRLTDTYGDIPYDEAGVAFKGIITPKYDDQEYIYNQMFLELDEAMQNLEVAVEGGFEEQDIIFNGDITKWQKFGNALRLRLAMRVKHVDRNKSQEEALKAFNGGLLDSNADNARNYSTQARNNYQHPLWQVSTSQGGAAVKISSSFVEFMKGNLPYRDGGNLSNVDPRLDVLVSDNSNGEKFGIPQGHTSQYYSSNPQWVLEGSFADYHNKSVRPVMIMNYSEVQFLLAEAVLEGYSGITGSATGYYEKGILASITDLDVLPGSYVTDEAALFDQNSNNEAKLERIIYQKWIGIFPDAHEAWAEQRRTGYPVVKKRSGVDYSKGITNGTIPNRISYPQGERNVNGQNVDDAISQQGGDDLLNKVWWDKKNLQDIWE